MAHLIDKDALLREIDKLKQNLSASPIVVIEDVISLVESLEVKEVGLDRKDVAEKAKNFATKDLVYCLSSPREKCVTCYNWLTQEDVGPNDFPQCSENKSSCRDYLLGYSDTCSYYIDL